MLDIGRRSLLYFGASAANMVIAFATLPLATRVLGPADYGAYSVAVTCSLIVQSVAGAMHLYLVPAQIGQVVGIERHKLISTIVINAFAVTTILTLVIGAVAFGDFTSQFASPHFSPNDALLMMGATICVSPWLVGIDVLPLDGRAASFASVTIVQATTSASSLLVSLFAFGLGPTSLYVAYFFASLAAGGMALFALRRDLHVQYSTYWLRESKHQALFALGQRLSETGFLLLERSTLAGFVGLRSVGLYTHGQTYSSALMMVINAFSRSMMPVNMEEARQQPPTFGLTVTSWVPVQLLAVASSIGFALIGDKVIGLLTNGKFTGAHFLAYLLLIALAIQTGGKCEISFLIARGYGNVFARINILSIVCGSIALFLLVPFIGISGAPLAAIIRALVVRISVIARVRTYHRMPFRDGTLLAGLVVSALSGIWVFIFAPPFEIRAMVAVPVAAASLFLLYRTARPLWRLRRPSIAC